MEMSIPLKSGNELRESEQGRGIFIFKAEAVAVALQ